MNKMREKRGFSLVETMVASLVVAIGLVALLELFAPALTDTKLARNQVVAASLAQEGVELARNRRDNNMLASRPFNEGLSGWLCLDFDSSTAAGATYGACDGTLYRFGNGRLVHNSAGEKSVFARRIHISTVGENMTVISYVKWEDGSFPTSPTDTAACNLRSKCSFAIATLSAWR